ncbi:hypothetical protein F511_37908 [Dorcoceras hygrometricum]|uniref:Uncharacterized protein n=1 Tax=Dorcoceras hygrometricum TaxID=472368 RepID=A0A2Z7CPJ8_9LAMI|nr:hypothetical protein F511_37908 [Dorcoceras hygrometricum]
MSDLSGDVMPFSDSRFGDSGMMCPVGTVDFSAWFRPISRGNRHFTVGGGRLRQSGPRPDGRLLRQPVLEGLTRSARTETPRKVGRNKFRRGAAAAFGRGGRRRLLEL